MHIRRNYEATVTRVIDGDTILVQMKCPTCAISQQLRIRLARIDAPELDEDPPTRAQQAKSFLAYRIEGQPVIIALKQKWPDKYGRLIAEVIHNGDNVSNWLAAANIGCILI